MEFHTVAESLRAATEREEARNNAHPAVTEHSPRLQRVGNVGTGYTWDAVHDALRDGCVPPPLFENGVLLANVLSCIGAQVKGLRCGMVIHFVKTEDSHA